MTPSNLDVPARRTRRQRAWDHWYRRAFPAYWLGLFCINHFPGLKLLNVRGDDKVAHLTAFALLAFLLWRFAQTFDRDLSPRFVWLAAATLTAYAAFDEYTQQFVYRGTDIADFQWDVIGAGATLALLEWRRRAVARRAA